MITVVSFLFRFFLIWLAVSVVATLAIAAFIGWGLGEPVDEARKGDME